MGFTYRQGNEGRLSITQMDDNFLYAEEQISSATASIATLNTNLASATASIVTLNTNLASVTASIATLNTNLASATASITTLNTNLASATASIATLNTNLASATASIADLEQLVGGSLPVLTTYPVTASSSAGTRFWYKGNEWHYMTQDEIDSTGWTGLISVGFPAPVNKTRNDVVMNNHNESTTISLYGSYNSPSTELAQLYPEVLTEFDLLGVGSIVNKINTISFRKSQNPGGISKIRNANLLTSLEDFGTQVAVALHSSGPPIDVSALVLNDFFTQLPPTTKTATIRLSGCSGAETCDSTIATAKGYTIIT